MKKKILVAPLNWGIGHATRCIPIIRALILEDFEPIIASDGEALLLLEKEFPKLKSYELPSYNIKYTKEGSALKWSLLKSLPRLYSVIKKEHRILDTLIEKHKLDGIISDNRLGLHTHKKYCVYITHQINIRSGLTTWLTSKIHQSYIKKFNICWVPDFEGNDNLSGKLSRVRKDKGHFKYIGLLSRLNYNSTENKYDLMVLLSGPEPQRTLLYEKLLLELIPFKGRVLFVKGLVEDEQIIEEKGSISIYNFMLTEALEDGINSSELIISRSGYSTVMDLVKLKKKAFFIPTPGQTEQEYLATRLEELNYAPYCFQSDFNIEKLGLISRYKGLNTKYDTMNYKELFRHF